MDCLCLHNLYLFMINFIVVMTITIGLMEIGESFFMRFGQENIRKLMLTLFSVISYCMCFLNAIFISLFYYDLKNVFMIITNQNEEPYLFKDQLASTTY